MVDIPRWHPARVNQLLGGHWARGHKLKSRDRFMVLAYARDAKVPPATGRRRVRLKIVLLPGQRGGDPDCYFKSLLDALTGCGALADDNRQHVELAPVEYERGTRDDWGTVITLEDVPCP
ncbi:MAG TPA: hypothetical protein VD866_06355 [Urbifossiella sp.]|nr:hypothetical protein [Urbifossiella sp.]